jgi:AhpD family alkylhydroperoxidase
MQVLLQAQDYVENSGLDKKLILLIKMRVSQINSCAYCLDMHSKDGIAEGETVQRLVSLDAWRETSYYTPKEQAVLAFAETLTHLPAEESSDHIHDELNKYFSKEEIAKITLAVVQINSWNRIVRSFGPVAGSYQPKHKVVAN